jgi:hypothetical protein
MRAGRGEALQQACACQRPQLAAQRLRGCDQQVAQLAEPRAFGVDRAFPCSYQRLQRLALAASPWCGRPLLGQCAARSTDRVERIGLAARAALPTQPADLEHPLAMTGQEAREAGTERAGSFDCEGSSTARVLVGELQRLRVTVAVRLDRRLRDDRATDDVHDRECVRVAVRVDTDDVVQLICEHPRTDLQPSVGGHEPVSVWGWKPQAAEL